MKYYNISLCSRALFRYTLRWCMNLNDVEHVTIAVPITYKIPCLLLKHYYTD